MYTNRQEFNTETGHSGPNANAHATPTATSGDTFADPGIDTAGEARRVHEQLAGYANELNDPAVSDHRKAVVTRLKESLERALPYQVGQWKRIDEQRARTAAMARGGLNRLAGSR
jgi:hypothetical protein